MDLIIFLHVIIESGFAMFCILAAIYIRFYSPVSGNLTGIMTCGLLTSAVINIFDPLAYLFRGNVTSAGIAMTRASNFIVFAGMIALLAVGNNLIDRSIGDSAGEDDRRLRDFVYIVCGAALLSLAMSRVFGFYYYFDEQNIYHRGKAYVVLPLLAVIALACMTVRTVRARNTLTRGRYFAFLCFCLLPVAGAILQTVIYGVSYSNIANSISLIIIFAVFIREVRSALSIRKSFILSGESIDSISEDIDRFLEGVGTETQNRIRIRFTIEEALLRIRQHFGEPEMVKITADIQFGRPSIHIQHYGEAFNPFIRTGESDEDWSSGLLSSAGLSPNYLYARGRNLIKISLARMSVNPVITVLIAILFGLLTGIIATAALSEGDARFVSEYILVPVYNLWNNMLFSVSAPAMLLIVMSTMLNTREVSDQGGSTGAIMVRYFLITLLMGAVTVAASGLVVGSSFRSGRFTRYTAAYLISKLFSVIPENLVKPIIDFNSAQLIMMGVVIAYAIMAVGQQAGGLESIVQQLDMIAIQLAQWIARFMPFFTAFLTAKLVIDRNAGLLTEMIMVFPLALAVSVVCIAAALVYVSLRTGVNPGKLFKKLMPSFLATLRTGQVADTYALAVKCCIRDLGIQKVFTKRMMPVGLVLYMPVSMIGMISFVIYAAVSSDTVISPMWILTAIIFSLILLLAGPPIPGVNLLSYVVIIEQLNISREFVLAAMIFDFIFGLFSTAANQMMLQMDLMVQADHVGMLDHAILKKTEEKNASA